jgi:putative MATE family efflux protein
VADQEGLLDTDGQAAPRLPPMRGDLTQGPILRTLIGFSLPALFSQILQTIGGSINAIWVGQLLGETAVAATANANILMFLMFGTVFGFGMATTIAVGRNMGARNIDAARHSFGGGIGFCTGLAVLIAVVGWIFAEEVLRLLATPPEVRKVALDYLRITFVSMPFATIAMMIGMGLRGAGDATTPLINSILTVVIGAVLNPLLILGVGPIPALGIAGSALAGALSMLIGAVVMIWTVYWKDNPLRLRGRELAYLFPSRAELAYMVTKGLPMGAQTMLSTAAGLIMVGLVNREGMLATAAYGASLQLWNYVQMPAMAVGSAMSTMVAQNVGARQHDRIGRITMAGIWVTCGVTATLTAIILLFDRPILGLFLGHGSAAIPLAEHIQLVCNWSFLLGGIMMALFATMRAYGSVMIPMLVMFVAMYPGRIGFYVLAHPVIGAEAVWWAYPVGSALSVVLSVLAYRHGPWRRLQTEAIARDAAPA